MHAKQLRSALSVTVLIALIFMVSHARAGQRQLAWDAPTTYEDGTSLTDLSSYTLYYWQANWEFPASVNVGNSTTYDLAELNLNEGQTYSFAVTASNTSGTESTFSNEISYTVAPLGAPVDTDGDGLADADELTIYGTDPTLADTDADGLSDGEEVATYGTDPLAADTDADGVDDGAEVASAFDPTDPTSTPGAAQATDLVAAYTFEEGSGTTVYDVSGIAPPLDLTVSNGAAISWVDGGLALHAATLVASAGAATKVMDAVQASNELTLEAWLKPANTTQKGPARIVTLSQDPSQRNFTLGQRRARYDLRLRTTATSTNGIPSLTTPAGTLTTALTHVVYTRDTAGVARLYVDGVEQASATVGGDFATWTSSYRLALGNELTGDRPWLGELHLVALYQRALSPAEVQQRFDAGPVL